MYSPLAYSPLAVRSNSGSPHYYYSTLAPDPLPLGPRMTSPVAPILRLLLRLVNVALAALSLLLIGAALWMAALYRHSGGGGAGGLSPEPAPGGHSPGPHAAAAFVASFPWFIYTVGLMGAASFGTALVGLTSGGTPPREQRLRLGAYIALLSALLLAHALAALLLLTDNPWRRRLPDDPSGRWAQLLRFVGGNGRGVRLAAVALLGAELAALGAACWLHAIYTAAWEAWCDDREEQSQRARAALQRTVAASYSLSPAPSGRGGSGAGGAGSARKSSWAARLASKYGIEASGLEATTLAARQVAALQDDDPGTRPW